MDEKGCPKCGSALLHAAAIGLFCPNAACSVADGPFGESLYEMDLEAFLNMREWLEAAVKAAGAEVTDAGIGGGQADIGVLVDGAPFSISIRPRAITPGANPSCV